MSKIVFVFCFSGKKFVDFEIDMVVPCIKVYNTTTLYLKSAKRIPQIQ